MTVYFTSDLHLGHTAVLAFAQRPWATIEEHDAAIIDNINATVGHNDELYILGDFTFRFMNDDVKPYLDAIRCHNRWLVLGNHDKAGYLRKPGAFKGVAPYMELREQGRLCVLSHYPMLDWNLAPVHHGVDLAKSSYMLHGHIHSQGRGYNGDCAREGIWRYDVGVDANGYKPVSFEEIDEFIKERSPLPTGEKHPCRGKERT